MAKMELAINYMLTKCPNTLTLKWSPPTPLGSESPWCTKCAKNMSPL